MAEFLFTGTAKLVGVSFLVEAENIEEARRKAKAGDIIDSDTSVAEMAEFQLTLSSGEENK